MQGVGFRPVRAPARGRAGRWPASCSTTSAACWSRSRASRRRSRASWRGCAPRRRRWRAVERVAAEALGPPASAGFAIRASPRGGAARRAGRRPTPRPATTACASCSTRPTAATATRSSTARTAARASRSCAASRTTGRSRRWPASRCARPARPSTTTPRDRRFHAQPNACPDCGPRLRLGARGDAALATRRSEPPMRCAAARSWRSRASAATTSPAAPTTRRAVARAAGAQAPRGQAVRADGRDVAAAARALVDLGAEDERAAGRRAAADRARAAGATARRWRTSVAPALGELGVMLPYTPLHHLLLADAGVPARDDERQRLRRADRLRGRGRAASGSAASPTSSWSTTARSTRAPTTRCVRAAARGAAAAAALARLRARRARRCRWPAPPLLACGAELKSTFCLAKGGRAWVGAPHRRPAQLRDAALLHRRHRALRAPVRRRRPSWSPTTCIPEYLSTKYALERDGRRHVGVQHHHAHLAACLAEHGETGPGRRARSTTAPATAPTARSGAASCWSATSRASSASGTCWPVRLPGGDARDPRAVADGLRLAGAVRGRRAAAGLAGEVDAARWRAVAELSATGFASPLTTSVGRLFDAVAALCGAPRRRVTYEGQAAMELEAASDPQEEGAYAIALEGTAAAARRARVSWPSAGGRRARRAGGRRQRALPQRGGRGHGRSLQRVAARARPRPGRALRWRVPEPRPAGANVGPGGAAGLRVLTPAALPPNDGGISFGQAAVAAAQAAARP